MSNPGPVAPTAVTSTPRTKPADYIMGVYEESQSGKGDWHIIAGCKTKADWSGIDYIEPAPTYIPMQKRRFRSKYETTEYIQRVTPMTTEFKEGMSPRELKLAVEEHGREHGLTTWMYLPDPNNEQEMVNVVENHSIFLGSPEGTIRQALKQAESYNSFDR